MKSSGRWFWLFSGCLATMTCITLIAIVGLLAWQMNEIPVADLLTPVSRATSAPLSSYRATNTLSATSTPEPTNTLVIQPGTPLPILAPPVRVTTRPSSLNAGIPTPTITGVSTRVKYDTKFMVNTYNVTGKTLNEVSASLDAQAMPDPHEPGSRYYARTDWYLTGDWSWKTSPSGCEVASAQVRVAVTMTLPVLAGEVGPEVQKRWDSFIENTIAHENGHVKLAYDGARNYQRELDSLAPAANCDILSNRLKEMFRKNFDQIDRASTDFDKRTRHGETEGAVFP